jgi:hypothetical protein
MNYFVINNQLVVQVVNIVWKNYACFSYNRPYFREANYKTIFVSSVRLFFI